MLCEHCHGKGVVRRDGVLEPCAECGGLGVLHCCEGLQAQPGGPGATSPGTEEAPDTRERAANG